VPQDPEPIAASDERAIPRECQAIAGGLEEVALQAIQFDFDASTITPEAREILAANVRCLEYLPASTVVIEGHCDERGTSEYNLALGDARAAAVARYLALLGVASDRLRPLTKGENEPLCNDSTETCWAKNRRAQLVTSSR
jgi:peptidoglycan-associated lipoprotein